MFKIIRIIAGTRRGLRLKTKEGLETRPTLDRIRENVFNILMTRIKGSRGLDLFSGSGAVGIEALSRGAEEVVFVEKDKKAYAVIKENLEKSQLTGGVLQNNDWKEFLLHSKKEFDWIYVDPPYGLDNYEDVLEIIGDTHSLVTGGVIIIEAPKSRLILESKIFTCFRKKNYGNTTLWFYEKM